LKVIKGEYKFFLCSWAFLSLDFVEIVNPLIFCFGFCSTNQVSSMLPSLCIWSGMMNFPVSMLSFA